MRLVRFLSRLAFICNICFLLLSVLRYVPSVPDNALISDLIILGYFGPIAVNMLVNVIVVLLFFLRRVWASGVPRWLLITNFIFFVIQILFFYRFNQPVQ
jgi:hypothetical protein